MSDWNEEQPVAYGVQVSRGIGASFGRDGYSRGTMENSARTSAQRFHVGRARGKKILGSGGGGPGKVGVPNGVTSPVAPVDDWDDDAAPATSRFSGGGGFGVPNGFGGGGGGGSGEPTNGAAADDWDNDGGFGSGGGSSTAGFGFKRSEDSEPPRGGGFAGRKTFGDNDRRGTRSAHHRSRGILPPGGRPPGGGGGGQSCYKCGEEGHFSRECPTSGSSGRGGGGGRSCYKCGEEGHMARECPSSGGAGGGRGGFGGGRSGGSSTCYKCNEEGHIARECPNEAESGRGAGRSNGGGFGDRGGFGSAAGGGSGGSTCYKCNEEGHFARECPNQGESGQGGGRSNGGGFGDRGGSGGSTCYKCNEEGHFARECPNQEDSGTEKKREPNYIPPAPPEDEEAIFLSMQRGINFDKYDEIPVECTGDGAPARGISSFDEADLSNLVRENVHKARYEKPTPIQRWAIPIIRQGRDLMACAQTGSGKTAAFLLPVLTGMVQQGAGGGSLQDGQTPMALVVGPTRELVLQIYNEARKFAHGSILRPVVVYGGTSVQHQASMLARGANMVIGTPGRLLDFINRGRILLTQVKYVILDEADRMLDMGFGPEVKRIIMDHGMPPKTERQTLMFSATFPEEIQRMAKEYLNHYLFVTVGRVGAANTDIQQKVFEVSQFDKREKIKEILTESGQDRVLVFVETKRTADFLASFLSQSEFPTTSIHGDRLQREREEALGDFKSGRAPVLVATSVAARGLDIPGVKHVVNYDLPSSIDEYVHRIGRTGRCGNLGLATCFFDPNKDADLARSLVKVLEDAQQEVPNFLEVAAEMGTGTGFGGVGGRFGGRDTRRGNDNNGDFGGADFGDFGDGGGFSQAVEDESWD